MLRLRPEFGTDEVAWQSLMSGSVAAGLNEDTDYLLDVQHAGSQVFVDDVELSPEGPSVFRWRPAFYAGRVSAEVIRRGFATERYLLDVSPSVSKSGQEEFDEMVAEIRAFDQSLLNGLSSATMAFGREGDSGRYRLDVLLSRVREHGPSFLSAVEAIAQSPHRFLVADTQSIPLSRVRRLHHAALRDRRLVAIATGSAAISESIDTFQVNGLTSAPTFDTPANRALMALVKRFRATVVSLKEAVERLQLGSPREEQLLRTKKRLHDLNALAERTTRLLIGSLFRGVSKSETSSAGLTQISAQPNYSKAYRLGSRALATQTDGNDVSDQLHVPPSWGIYETWCFLCVADGVSKLTGKLAIECPCRATFAERAARFDLPGGHWLEVLFQATFPSLKPASTRLGWSLSGERRPDLVLVHHSPSGVAAMIFDAKWRSGRENVLQSMESAHLYHDALRIGSARITPCVLLFPGSSWVPELEKQSFIQAHGVGAVSSVRTSAPGVLRVQQLVENWISAVL